MDLSDSHTKIINLPNSHIAKIAKTNIKTKYNKNPNMDRRGYSNIPNPVNNIANIRNIKPTKNAFIRDILYLIKNDNANQNLTLEILISEFRFSCFQKKSTLSLDRIDHQGWLVGLTNVSNKSF